MIETSRRSFIQGVGALAGMALTAPAIVHAGNIMPVRSLKPAPVRLYLIYEDGKVHYVEYKRLADGSVSGDVPESGTVVGMGVETDAVVRERSWINMLDYGAPRSIPADSEVIDRLSIINPTHMIIGNTFTIPPVSVTITV